MSENTGYNFYHKKVINDLKGIRIKKAFSAIFPFESNFALLPHLKDNPPDHLYYYLPNMEKEEEKALKMFGSSLGLADGEIDGIKNKNHGFYERCYKVLKTWRQRDGTYVNLAKALEKHAFEAAFHKYCLRKHDPLTEKTEELRKFPARLFF